MKLRGINFGACLDAAGARGFFGEGYWFHHLWFVRRWFSFNRSVRVTKTTTLYKQPGNMLLVNNIHQVDRFPTCIWMNWLRGIALNAIGLSGPGAKYLFEHGLLAQTTPFMISFMSVAKNKEERLDEFHRFVDMLKQHIASSPHKLYLGLQINISCPNTGLDPGKLVSEALTMLDIAQSLYLPVGVKINLLAPIEVVREIASHSACDFICCTNTIPFGTRDLGSLMATIDWDSLVGPQSPLARFGGGGLSGKTLLPLVAEWVGLIRASGIDIPLNVGGGILKPEDVDTLVEAGLRPKVDSIFIGSVAFLRPWRINAIIRRAHQLLG